MNSSSSIKPSLLLSHYFSISYQASFSISIPPKISSISDLEIVPLPSKSNKRKAVFKLYFNIYFSYMIEAVINSVKSTFPELFESNYSMISLTNT